MTVTFAKDLLVKNIVSLCLETGGLLYRVSALRRKKEKEEEKMKERRERRKTRRKEGKKEKKEGRGGVGGNRGKGERQMKSRKRRRGRKEGKEEKSKRGAGRVEEEMYSWGMGLDVEPRPTGHASRSWSYVVSEKIEKKKIFMGVKKEQAK
jgi:hypothetical protein